MEECPPISSQDIKLQEKCCIFDNNDNVAIFDEDNTVEDRLGSQRQIFKPVSENQADPQLMTRIEQEIKSSKENFFSVKVVREENRPRKMMRNEQMRLATRNKDQAQIIIKEGYLEKKYNSNIFFKWNKRFFALNSDKLYCFSDRSKERTVACVNFKRLPAQLKQSQGLEIEVDFFGQCESLLLKCQNLHDKKQWVESLHSVIEVHCLESKMLFKTISKPFYEDKDSLTQREFIEMSETGDVLLFFTDHTGGKLQRFFTASDYDHVAMVVKFDKNETMVFEANQLSGVALYDWKYYIHYFDLYQKVAIRKLKFVRKQELHQKFLNFVKRNLGKNYDLSALKLFKQESHFDWNNMNKAMEEDRGFFCSELVAKAYKTVGLLEPKRASSKYWPVDFSQKGQLKLNLGASLEREQMIVLNKHLKKKL